MNTKLPSIALASTLCFSGMVQAKEPIQPIRPTQEINLAQAEPGKKLYFDLRLSTNRGLSPVIPATTRVWVESTICGPPSGTAGSKVRSTRPRCSTPA